MSVNAFMDMGFDEAKRVIRDPDASFFRHVVAANVISFNPKSSYLDLLECLYCPGLPAETAAIQLYIRTKRPRQSNDISSFIADHDDWKQYLTEKKLIEAQHPASADTAEP